MKIYVVGGAVRDELLGLPVQDRDYVVVGATPEEMARLGYKPVGKDFPVFLHPQTHEEYALARTERKSGRGYKGFTVHASPDVTLEDDLRRRDLTINAMAKAEDGTLIDPYGGKRDLEHHILRHVSEAFAEDPVRILRVARFAARFSNSSSACGVAMREARSARRVRHARSASSRTSLGTLSRSQSASTSPSLSGQHRRAKRTASEPVSPTRSRSSGRSFFCRLHASSTSNMRSGSRSIRPFANSCHTRSGTR